jgi:hypothetical protein
MREVEGRSSPLKMASPSPTSQSGVWPHRASLLSIRDPEEKDLWVGIQPVVAPRSFSVLSPFSVPPREMQVTRPSRADASTN